MQASGACRGLLPRAGVVVAQRRELQPRPGPAGRVRIPARHGRGRCSFPDVAARAARLRGFRFNSLNAVFEGKASVKKKRN